MITRSIQARPPRRISRDERDLWIALDPHVGSSAVMRPLRTWAAARRSVLDRFGHHVVPTCRRGDISALAMQVSRPKMMSLRSAAVVSGWSVMINNLILSIRVMKDAAETAAHCAAAAADGPNRATSDLWIALDPHVGPTSRGPKDRLERAARSKRPAISGSGRR